MGHLFNTAVKNTISLNLFIYSTNDISQENICCSRAYMKFYRNDILIWKIWQKAMTGGLKQPCKEQEHLHLEV